MTESKELTNEEKKELKKEAKEQIKKKEENNSKKTEIYEKLDREEKVRNYFDNIEFLSLSDEEKQKVAVEIKTNSKIDKLYIIEIILSALIVTLGLLQNSVAVVVGAMLIAPILRPLNGLSYSIARGGQSIFKNSFFMLFVSVFLSIFLAFGITKIIGINNETNEIISRINPNLIDFFIAIFSGMVGVMSIKFRRLGAGISGVAMAVALLPPLSVVGIEIALGSFTSALGAFLLFLTNILAIAFVSIIFFWLYGFTPHEKKLQSKVFIRLMITLAFLIGIFFPLSWSYENVKIGNKISTILNSGLKNNENIEITNLQILKNTEKEINLKIGIKAVNKLNLENILQEKKNNLEKVLQKKVNIEFNITRFLKI